MSGLSWPQLIDVTIKFQHKRIGFESSYCQQYCQHHSSMWVWGASIEKSESEEKKLDICTASVALFM